jgi:hypothetical protein
MRVVPLILAVVLVGCIEDLAKSQLRAGDRAIIVPYSRDVDNVFVVAKDFVFLKAGVEVTVIHDLGEGRPESPIERNVEVMVNNGAYIGANCKIDRARLRLVAR